MRPANLDEYVGQRHLLALGKPLRNLIERRQAIPSLLLWGPPGTGKTTLARLIASRVDAHFEPLSAVTCGVKELREVVERARQRQRAGQRTLLFLDEIHRFNKSQQDGLLPHVEEGLITLVGATTENPYHEVNRALLSRSQLFQLQPLQPEDLEALLLRALREPVRGLGHIETDIDPEALDYLVQCSGGDARAALNLLELAVCSAPYDSEGRSHVTLQAAQDSLGKRTAGLGTNPDSHYDMTSALIKSIRGSDPDASLYWMARMVVAGEEPGFIFRRLLILAAEDIGLADPNAMLVATSCAQAADRVGYPEAKYHLAVATLYLAAAPKSNSAGAYFAAQTLAEKTTHVPPPPHLRDSHYAGAEKLGHGNTYQYPHDFPGHFVKQNYWPDAVRSQEFYQPGDLGFEQRIAARLSALKEET